MKAAAYLLIVICGCLLVVSFSRDACGYLDPGTGSYVLQLIIAGVVGSLFMIKIFWRRLTTFVSGLFMRKAHDDSK